MISAIVLLSAFDSYHIADVFHYTNYVLVPAAVGANAANISVAYIVAPPAKPDVVAHFADGLAEMYHIGYVLPEQV